MISKRLNSRLKRLIPLGVFVSSVAAISIAASCSNSGEEQPLISQITVDANKLKQVKVGGSSFNPIFEVPQEITNINQSGAFDASGSRQALYVLGRTRLQLTASENTNNRTFMPLKLLQAYVSGRLRFADGKLIYNEGSSTIDVAGTYGSLYGFNQANVTSPHTLGIYDRDSFDLQFRASSGINVTNISELEKTVAINSSELKTYVDLKLILEANTAQLNRFRSNFEFASNSTHQSVIWTNPLTFANLPTIWKPFVQRVGFMTKLSDSPTANQPTSLDYNNVQRSLFLHMMPTANVSFATTEFNVASYANLAMIPTDLTISDDYAKLTPATWKAAIRQGQLSVDTLGQNLPLGLQIQYAASDVGTPVWESLSEFNQQLAQRLERGDQAFRIRLTGSESTQGVYVLNPPVTFVLQFPEQLKVVNVEALRADLLAQQVNLADSSAERLVWDNSTINLAKYNIPELLSLSYLYGDYTSAEAAAAASGWTNTLPTLPLINLVNQKLWVRVNVTENAVAALAFFDLSASSKLSEFINTLKLTEVNAAPLKSLVESLQITPASTHAAVLWNRTLPPIPSTFANSVSYAEYLSGNFKTLEAASAAPNSAWRSSLPTALDETPDDRRLFVRFMPRIGYKLTNAIFDISDSSLVKTARLAIDTTLSYRMFQMDSVKFAVVDNALVLSDNYTLPLHTSLEWKVNNSWISTSDMIAILPSFTSKQDFAGIQVRLKSDDSTKYVLSNDLTATANFEAVGGFVNKAAVTAELAKLRVDANADSLNLKWLNSPELLEGVESYEYLLGEYPSLDSLQGATWTTFLPRQFSPQLSRRDLWARPKVASGFVASNVGATRLVNAGLEGVAIGSVVNTDSIEADLNSIVTTNEALNTALVFNKNFTIPDDYKWAIARVEFIAGNYPSGENAANSSEWSTELPKTIGFYTALRYMWARLIPVEGVNLAKTYFNLTGSSKVRNTRSVIDSTNEFKNLNMGNISLEGTYDSLVVNTAVAYEPDHSQFLFSYQYLPRGAVSTVTVRNLTKQALVLSVKEHQNDNIIHDSFYATLALASDTDSQLNYVIKDVKEGYVSVKYLFKSATFDPAAEGENNAPSIVTVMQRLFVFNSRPDYPSTSDKVDWKGIAYESVTLPNEIFSYDVTLTETAEEPDPDARGIWRPPYEFNRVNFDYSKRFLWVRFYARPGITLTKRVFSFTDSSGIKDIPSVLNTYPGFNDVSLSGIKLTGDRNAPLINSTYAEKLALLPSGVVIRFEYTENGEVKTRITAQGFYELLRDLKDSADFEAILRSTSVRIGLADESSEGRKRIIIREVDYKRTALDLSEFNFSSK